MAHPEIQLDDSGIIIFTLANKPDLLIMIDKVDYFKHVHNTNHWYVHYSTHQKKPKPYVRSHWVNGVGHKHLHREVLGVVENWSHESVVDHINNDSLDIRMCNLRKCTTTENVRASKIPAIIYRGVSITAVRQRFQSYVGRKYIGSHKTVEGMKIKIDAMFTEASHHAG